MFGFIGIQRVVIAVIMPAIKKDLGFSYFQQGMIVSITGLTWAFGTIIFAAIGDRYGRRPVIAICTILSGFFSWITGTIHSVGQLMAIRGFLGLFEGGPYPLSMGTINEEAPPHRRAMNAGLVTGSFMLIGICIGSQVAVWLLERFGSWRPVFYVVSIPAILIGILLYTMTREAPSVTEAIRRRKAGQKVASTRTDGVSVWDVLKSNVLFLHSTASYYGMALHIHDVLSFFFLSVHKFRMLHVRLIISLRFRRIFG
jgi:MFS family permease